MGTRLKRIGKCSLNKLLNDYVNIYTHYENMAKEINTNSKLYFHGNKKIIYFYVEIDDIDEYEKIE